MHYEVNYTALTGDEKIRKACADALGYMGPKIYRHLVTVVKYKKYSVEQVHFLAMIAGVQGYPVEAMLARYRIEDQLI